MIGYVRAYKPEMKIKHYEEYRAVYCSLCRTLGKRYGSVARLMLSYDLTFFALLQMSVQPERPCFEKKRCPFNPTKKCNFCTEKNSYLEYTADVTMLMVYHKIIDDIHDEGIFRKMLMLIIRPIFYFYYRKAKKYAPDAERIIADSMKQQSIVEKEKNGDPDIAADASAQALSELLSLNMQGNEKRIAKRIGYLLGRWVYLTDAYFDMKADRKKGRYNPFNIEEKNEDEIKAMLNITVGEMISAYELLNVRQFDAVIRNILIDGLYNSMENGGAKRDERSI